MTRVLEVGPRRVRWSYALLPALLLVLLACGDDDTSRSEEIVAPAVDACSRVGSSGDLGPCEDSVQSARERCATLSEPAAANCGAELDALTVAAREAYYLHHGQCDAMTSDAARSACTLTASLLEPTATPTVAAAVPTAPPGSSSSGDDGASEAESALGPALAAALWACGIAEATEGKDGCEQALEEAEEFCDRLELKPARNDCERTLKQFKEVRPAEGLGNGGRGRGGN